MDNDKYVMFIIWNKISLLEQNHVTLYITIFKAKPLIYF